MWAGCGRHACDEQMVCDVDLDGALQRTSWGAEGGNAPPPSSQPGAAEALSKLACM